MRDDDGVLSREEGSDAVLCKLGEKASRSD